MSDSTIRAYYDAFNRGDAPGMLVLLTDDFVHEPSQSAVRHGKDAFTRFLAHMDKCYAEEVLDLVVMVSGDGSRGAAEFMLNGTYLVSDEGLPEAHGQTYRLRVGAFFAFRDGKIARVSNHYNLADWIRQVS